MEAVKAINLTRAFGSFVAVDNLNFSIQGGELFGVVGPDGSGKTTLMRLLASILDPSSGEAWVLGYNTVSQAELIKEQIGYMSQKFGLYPDLNVMENMEFYADLYGVPTKEKQRKFDYLLEFSNLTPFKKRLSGYLSGGMKQKLSLACVLLHNPKLIFLDEPTAGVDPVSRRDFWRILYELLRQKVTIVISTSYMDEAERCRRVGFMHKGKLISTGTPNDIKKQMNHSILEISTESPREVLEIIRKEKIFPEVHSFGNRIHVQIINKEDDWKLLENVLWKIPNQRFQIRPIEPSLEDVFIYLLSKGHKSSNY